MKYFCLLSLLGFLEFQNNPFYAQVNKIINVGQRTLNYIDSSRNRPLKTEIWYPTTDEITPENNATSVLPFVLEPTARNASFLNIRYPLILLSHGTGGNRLNQAWLAINLAKKGYFVASVDHWGNTWDNKIADQFVKVWERPMDISFIISQLLSDTLYNKNIDSQRIGAAGFSLGGYTLIALAGGVMDLQSLQEYSQTKKGKNEFKVPEFGNLNKLLLSTEITTSYSLCPPLKDSRIIAFFIMAPALGQGFLQERQFAQITAPLFIIGVVKDQKAPLKTNAYHYHQMLKGSSYFEISGNAGHYVFLNKAKKDLEKDAAFYYKDDPTVDREQIHLEISKIALDFFQKELK